MSRFLSEQQRTELKYIHGFEDKRRYADRVKAVLLLDSGWTLTSEIIGYVKKEYGIIYSISGMTDLLHRIGFVYKKTKIVPGKADPEKQQEFLEHLDKLKASKNPKDKIYYLDGVHPQHNSQAGHAWILKGQEKKLKSNTGRKRININGALDIVSA